MSSQTGLHTPDDVVVDLGRGHGNAEAVVHVARPFLRAHAHHVGRRTLVPGATALPHEVLARRVPDLLGLDQHAVEIEDHRHRL